MRDFPKPHAFVLIRQWISKSALRLYVVFIVLACFPILLFSYYADRVLSAETEREAVIENSEVAELSAVLIAEHFRQSAALMESYAIDPEFQGALKRNDKRYVAEHMERAHALEPDSSLVSAYDRDGT